MPGERTTAPRCARPLTGQTLDGAFVRPPGTRRTQSRVVVRLPEAFVRHPDPRARSPGTVVRPPSTVESSAVTRQELETRLIALPSAERRKLLAFLRQNLPREEDPEDALNDAFVRAFQSVSELTDDSKWLAWFWGIASFVASDKRKTGLRRRRRFAGLEQDPTGREPTPAVQSQESERQARVRAALDELPQDERRVIELNVFAGLTQVEIAESLGWTLDRVKNRAKAGHKRLLELLKDVDL